MGRGDVLWTAAAGGAAAFMAWAVRGRSSTVFAPSIWHGDRRRREIALTFDDGPSESTPALLEILDRYHVKATFFVCGRNAERLPRIVEETAKAGHEIANHSWSHRRLDFASPAVMREEIGRAQDAIGNAAGVRPRLYRAPYGVRWFGLGKAQEEHGLMGMMWSTLGLDWKEPAARVSRRILSRVGPGEIICLHDGRELQTRPDIRSTLDAVREIVPRIAECNLAFVTGSAMLE